MVPVARQFSWFIEINSDNIKKKRDAVMAPLLIIFTNVR